MSLPGGPPAAEVSSQVAIAGEFCTIRSHREGFVRWNVYKNAPHLIAKARIWKMTTSAQKWLDNRPADMPKLKHVMLTTVDDYVAAKYMAAYFFEQWGSKDDALRAELVYAISYPQSSFSLRFKAYQKDLHMKLEVGTDKRPDLGSAATIQRRVNRMIPDVALAISQVGE